MTRLVLLAALAALTVSCGPGAYPAPPARVLPGALSTRWARSDSGDVEAIRAAEESCRQGLNDRAVSASFRAVDAVAEALVDLCTVDIVADDPLVWHVFCGSDATFAEGTYSAPVGGEVACMGGTAPTAFECIGRILALNLLGSNIRSSIGGVQIVSVGSVDRQRLSEESAFLASPCTDLQADRAIMPLPHEGWPAPTEDDPVPTEEERAGVWNDRLSWCRAAFGARAMRQGILRELGRAVGDIDRRMSLGVIGAGTDWLDSWRSAHRNARCPTAGERGQGQCVDARRVDLFVRVLANTQSTRAASCEPPDDLPGGEPARALYCLSECQTQAASGRNTEGYNPPATRPDLLFGRSATDPPSRWILDSETLHRVNTASVRSLLLGESG